MHLSQVLAQLYFNNQPFVCYKLPHVHQPVLLAGSDLVSFYKSPWEAQGKKGFIVVPFSEENTDPVIFFSSKKSYKGWHFDAATIETLTFSEHPPAEGLSAPPDTGFHTYRQQADRLIKLMQQGELQKVVLSRIITQRLGTDFDIGKLFYALCQKYPLAFIYVFNDGMGRIWVGASPEKLLQADGKKAQTVALAATRPSKQPEPDQGEWKMKEKNEQDIVSQYIKNILSENQVENISEGILQTIQAGPVIHLRRNYDFIIPEHTNPLNIALKLHPTPAVCGLPPEKAKSLIKDTELHQRQYYTGFLGEIGEDHKTNLFVNLRCMQLIGKTAFLYVGGGLLAASDINQEWEETIKKAETLLCMLKK